MVLYGLVPARESLGHISYVTPIAGDGARTHDSLLPLLSHNTICVFRVKKREARAGPLPLEITCGRSYSRFQ